MAIGSKIRDRRRRCEQGSKQRGKRKSEQKGQRNTGHDVFTVPCSNVPSHTAQNIDTSHGTYSGSRALTSASTNFTILSLQYKTFLWYLPLATPQFFTHCPPPPKMCSRPSVEEKAGTNERTSELADDYATFAIHHVPNSVPTYRLSSPVFKLGSVELSRLC